MSVVIPTLRRPQWVVEAVESALAQTHSPLEVIVVIDGQDAATVTSLQRIPDNRLRWIELPENVGGSEARNIGVRAASGEWIAFLDDDDLWLPAKITAQLEMADALTLRYPIVSCRLLHSGRILPRKIYSPQQAVSDYLFYRSGLSYGDGMLQTSTLIARRGLLLEEPLSKGLKRHQDWDWLLKVAMRPDVEIMMSVQPLVQMRNHEALESVSRSGAWAVSFEWARTARHLMSDRAYSSFIATECVPRARRCRAGWHVQLMLLRECLSAGDSGWKQALLFAFFSLVPERIRKTAGKLRRTAPRKSKRLGECAPA